MSNRPPPKTVGEWYSQTRDAQDEAREKWARIRERRAVEDAIDRLTALVGRDIDRDDSDGPGWDDFADVVQVLLHLAAKANIHADTEFNRLEKRIREDGI